MLKSTIWKYCQRGLIWMVKPQDFIWRSLKTQKLEPKRDPLSRLISFVFYILGGLLCFDIREKCMEEWKDKLMEFKMEGIWETVTEKKLSVVDDDKTNAFVFKLLWKILWTVWSVIRQVNLNDYKCKIHIVILNGGTWGGICICLL